MTEQAYFETFGADERVITMYSVDDGSWFTVFWSEDYDEALQVATWEASHKEVAPEKLIRKEVYIPGEYRNGASFISPFKPGNYRAALDALASVN